MLPKSESWIRTFSGVQFNPFEPRPEDVLIEDIAHALSNLCRFGGHCDYFYSVAQHSVYCAQMSTPKHKLALLLHDASEAYLVDMPRPIKWHLKEYKRIENAIQEAVRFRFNISTFDFPELHEIDNRVLMTEKRDIMSCDKSEWKTVKVPAYTEEELFITSWQPREAKERFLEMFNELYEQT